MLNVHGQRNYSILTPLPLREGVQKTNRYGTLRYRGGVTPLAAKNWLLPYGGGSSERYGLVRNK